jgi:LPS O-antigen subunit length determinant protein (WzzB/FepE family)
LFSVFDRDTPYYLAGYKAIEKEISVIENRTDQDRLALSHDYLDSQERVSFLENDTLADQIRQMSKAIEADSTNDWIEFDWALSDIRSYQKSRIYIALSLVLGFAFGVTLVLVTDFVKKRNQRLASS